MNVTHTYALVTIAAIAATLQAQDSAKKITIQPTAGTTAHFRATTSSTQTMEAMGQETTNEITADLVVQVDGIEKDGAVKATVTWLAVRGKLSSMMGQTEFDTTKPDKSDEGGDELAGVIEACHALVNKKVALTFAPTGKLQDKKPLQQLVDAALEHVEGMTKMSVQGMLSENTLEGQASVFGTFPSEPVKVGGEWTDKTDIPSRGGLSMQSEITSKLDSADAAAYTVSTRGTLSMAPAKEAAEDDGDEHMSMMRNMMREAKLDGSKLEGSYTVSRKDGMLTAANSVTNLNISMPNPMGGDQPFVVKVKQTRKLERVADAKPSKEAPPAPKK